MPSMEGPENAQSLIARLGVPTVVRAILESGWQLPTPSRVTHELNVSLLGLNKSATGDRSKFVLMQSDTGSRIGDIHGLVVDPTSNKYEHALAVISSGRSCDPSLELFDTCEFQAGDASRDRAIWSALYVTSYALMLDREKVREAREPLVKLYGREPTERQLSSLLQGVLATAELVPALAAPMRYTLSCDDDRDMSLVVNLDPLRSTASLVAVTRFSREANLAACGITLRVPGFGGSNYLTARVWNGLRLCFAATRIFE